jgi:hypothetical protein
MPLYWCRFIIVIIIFYKIETFSFNVTGQVTSLFSTIEIKQTLPFVAFFNSHFRELLLEYFPVSVVGNVHTFCWYYDISVVTVLQLSIKCHCQRRSPSNNHSSTQRQNRKSSEMVAKLKNCYLHFLLKWSPQHPLNTVVKLWITLYNALFFIQIQFENLLPIILRSVGIIIITIFYLQFIYYSILTKVFWVQVMRIIS